MKNQIKIMNILALLVIAVVVASCGGKKEEGKVEFLLRIYFFVLL
jgi:ABC-type Fe3+-citrate transport system substrate-binding protein